MKRENGAGSVTKMKDRRKKPWKVTVTTGYYYDPESGITKQKRKVVGCYRTRSEAENALSDFRRNPYDIDARKVTFANLYEQWSKIHYIGLSDSKTRSYKSAYNHAKPLHAMKFRDIRPHHIEKVMADADVGSATKNNVKSLCGQLYKYALKNEIVTINYASMCDTVKPDAPKVIRRIFTPDEENLLWQSLDIPFADMVIVALYSGWRPQELVSLKVSDVDIENRVMYGGVKTAAGKERAVPIHSAIMPLIVTRMNQGGERVFIHKDRPMTYSIYKNCFNKICTVLGFIHTPHDTRHTFITRGKEAGMNEHILKLIVGHTISDITEKIYTHRKIAELQEEIEKIKRPAVDHR